MQLLFSFDQDMKVEKTLTQTLATQLSSTLFLLLLVLLENASLLDSTYFSSVLRGKDTNFTSKLLVFSILHTRKFPTRYYDVTMTDARLAVGAKFEFLEGPRNVLSDLFILNTEVRYINVFTSLI